MTEEEQAIHDRAMEFARQHKKQIAKELTEGISPDNYPVSVFMAGSPGAGKTESSRNIIKRITKDPETVLRIDSDDLRKYFSEYNGANSHLFMGATSVLADRIHDIALEKHLNFVFDGTLSHLEIASSNIKRSLNKGRFVQILYVYQEPLQAWHFVQEREKRDGRKIPRTAFIQQYFKARENVNVLKKQFGKNIQVDLVIKNIDGTDFGYKENVDVIDNYIPEKYTQDDLETLIVE
jgi:predicted ABC-type ATPase